MFWSVWLFVVLLSSALNAAPSNSSDLTERSVIVSGSGMLSTCTFSGNAGKSSTSSSFVAL